MRDLLSGIRGETKRETRILQCEASRRAKGRRSRTSGGFSARLFSLISRQMSESRNFLARA